MARWLVKGTSKDTAHRNYLKFLRALLIAYLRSEPLLTNISRCKSFLRSNPSAASSSQWPLRPSRAPAAITNFVQFLRPCKHPDSKTEGSRTISAFLSPTQPSSSGAAFIAASRSSCVHRLWWEMSIARFSFITIDDKCHVLSLCSPVQARVECSFPAVLD